MTSNMIKKEVRRLKLCKCAHLGTLEVHNISEVSCSFFRIVIRHDDDHVITSLAKHQ